MSNSVSAAVGFISIFAIAIMDGILLNFYIHQLWNAGHSALDSIVMGADRRFRALMMTALVNGLGLLPAALSTHIGTVDAAPARNCSYRRCDLDRAADASVPAHAGLRAAPASRTCR